jgi:hypothetical protein
VLDQRGQLLRAALLGDATRARKFEVGTDTLIIEHVCLAESYLTSTLFRQILRRIERLAWHPT